MKNSCSKDSIFLLDKSYGKTSNWFLKSFKIATGIKKCGYAGTLDPFATGLMIVGVNKCTKLLTEISEANKEYFFVVQFGYETDSGDIDGYVVKSKNVFPSPESIRSVIESKFLGKITQVPPIYSALKKEGKKMCSMAREIVNKNPDISKKTPLEFLKDRCDKDIQYKHTLFSSDDSFLDKNININIDNKDFFKSTKELELIAKQKTREVNILSFDLLGQFNDSTFCFVVNCSKGTYIRKLVIDLAKELGTYANTVALRRLSIGDFSLVKSSIVDEISSGDFFKNSYFNKLGDLLNCQNLSSIYKPLATNIGDIFNRSINNSLHDKTIISNDLKNIPRENFNLYSINKDRVTSIIEKG